MEAWNYTTDSNSSILGSSITNVNVHLKKNKVMEDKEFVVWLKGFTEGVHHYSLSPKQWDYLKEKLQKVNNQNSKTCTLATTVLPEGYWVQNVS